MNILQFISISEASKYPEKVPKDQKAASNFQLNKNFDLCQKDITRDDIRFHFIFEMCHIYFLVSLLSA